MVKAFGFLLKTATVGVLAFLAFMRYVAQDREISGTTMRELFCQDEGPSLSERIAADATGTITPERCAFPYEQLTVGEPVMGLILLLVVLWALYVPLAASKAALDRRLLAEERTRRTDEVNHSGLP